MFATYELVFTWLGLSWRDVSRTRSATYVVSVATLRSTVLLHNADHHTNYQCQPCATANCCSQVRDTTTHYIWRTQTSASEACKTDDEPSDDSQSRKHCRPAHLLEYSISTRCTYTAHILQDITMDSERVFPYMVW
jgi:hypothetical protein